MSRKIRLAAVLVLVAISLVLLVVLLTKKPTQPLTVYFENAKNVRVLDASRRGVGGDDIILFNINKSGDAVRIPKDVDILVAYDGLDGYADGYSTPIGSSVRIRPDYSESRLDSMIAEALPEINSSLAIKYPKVINYTQKKGRLVENGAWYIGILQAKNQDEVNGDTLRYIANYKGGWQVVAAPSLLFTKFTTPSVPTAVLDQANGLIGG